MKLVIDGVGYPLARIVEVKVERPLLFIEPLGDGTFRLTVSKAFGLDWSRASHRIDVYTKKEAP